MISHPFFSVVVPTYNRADIIDKTISSVLNQSFRDFEIIIVDDGSTDNTIDIILNIQKNEPSLKLIKQENKERGAARNNGFRNATGIYVLFFDSDDVMHDDHLKILYNNIIEQNNPAFIATKFDFVDENGKHSPSDINKFRQGYYDYKNFLNGNPLACNICVRRENKDLFLFEENREYAIKEDWMFMLQNLQKQKLFIIDKITISMLDHPQRSMRSDNEKIIHRTQLALHWILEKVELTAEDRKRLLAHVNYFCGIHSYLGNKKKSAISYAFQAIRFGGLKIKYVMLALKSVAGKKMISRIK